MKRTTVLSGIMLATCIGCTAPGKGAKAERGYQRAHLVVAALASYRARYQAYPDSLSQLVPTFLSASALALPEAAQEHYPLQYARVLDGFTLSFRYTGPGSNRCTWTSATQAWTCSGLF